VLWFFVAVCKNKGYGKFNDRPDGDVRNAGMEIMAHAIKDTTNTLFANVSTADITVGH